MSRLFLFSIFSALLVNPDAFRALRVLKSADVILSEDTRHSGKLLHYYNIKTPLVSHFWVMHGASIRMFVCLEQ